MSTDLLHPVYITTAIDYVNAPPHLGHAYEKIATDALARFYKLLGHEVFFLTGTDEHGIKIEKNAKAKNLIPKQFVDPIAQCFQDTWALCGLNYNRFIRTTEAEHYEVVQAIWQKLFTQGDIYKASYIGRYCPGCEAFLTERDLNEKGECVIHLRKPDDVEEENYFFKLSAYKDRLKQYIEQNPSFVQPEFRRQEVLKMLDELEDISVSRSKKSVTWGIEVSDDSEQVIYVWIDALSNYLTGLDYLKNPQQFSHFWTTPDGEPNAIHIIGKDILRFHAIYWPALLMAASIPLPKTIFAHGFITLAEAKISKSLGNVIAPQDVLTHFNLPNADALRYYLLTATSFGQDGNFTMDDFKLRVNSDLANNLGNLLNRTLSMLQKYNHGVTPEFAENPYFDLIALAPWAETIKKAYLNYDLKLAAELVLSRVDAANKLINEAEPWTLFKEGQTEKLNALLYSLLESLRQVALLLSPMTPYLSDAILNQLGLEPAETLTWNQLNSPLPAGLQTKPAGPILPRLDDELAGDSKGKK